MTIKNMVASSIPKGDKKRTETFNFGANQSGVDIEILNLSGNGGFIGALYVQNNVVANLNINSFKVTIDGAAERTLPVNCFNQINTNYSPNARYDFSIPYNSSAVVKVNYDSGNTLVALGTLDHWVK